MVNLNEKSIFKHTRIVQKKNLGNQKHNKNVLSTFFRYDASAGFLCGFV